MLLELLVLQLPHQDLDMVEHLDMLLVLELLMDKQLSLLYMLLSLVSITATVCRR